MIDGLLGLGATAATGGLFGVFGAAIGRVAGVFEQREAFQQERARWEHEVKLRELSESAAVARAENERAANASQASYAGLEASIAAEAAAAGASYKWVEAVRSLVRPVLTVLLWLVYLAVFFAVGGENASAQASGTNASLADDFIANVAFAASAATLWWFGDRAPRPPPLAGGR